MDDLGRNIFWAIFTELLFVVLAIVLKDDKRKMVTVLVIGTLLAGIIGFWKPLFQFVLSTIPNSALSTYPTYPPASSVPSIDSPSNTDLPSLPETNDDSLPTVTNQVGPFWGWRNELGTETLMLNILSQGECISSVDMVVDGQTYTASLISSPADPHYRKENLAFEGGTGTSCNYLIGNNKAVRPSQYFSVPSATYGINLPPQQPYEWCFQTNDKTWYPCP